MQTNAQKITNIFDKPIDKHNNICYNEDAKGKRNQITTLFPKANVNIGGNDMKKRNVKVFLKTAMETNLPFVDKTRTMTGRVSENI